MEFTDSNVYRPQLVTLFQNCISNLRISSIYPQAIIIQLKDVKLLDIVLETLCQSKDIAQGPFEFLWL